MHLDIDYLFKALLQRNVDDCAMEDAHCGVSAVFNRWPYLVSSALGQNSMYHRMGLIVSLCMMFSDCLDCQWMDLSSYTRSCKGKVHINSWIPIKCSVSKPLTARSSLYDWDPSDVTCCFWSTQYESAKTTNQTCRAAVFRPWLQLDYAAVSLPW